MSKYSLNERAMNLLARREHSVKELVQKLRKDFDTDEIEIAISALTEANLQSDERFTENYLRYRSQRGFGYRKITLELKERGVSADVINDALHEAKINWFELAIAARCKRFGEQSPATPQDRAKQQRFMEYRGFTHEQITESFNTKHDEN